MTWLWLLLLFEGGAAEEELNDASNKSIDAGDFVVLVALLLFFFEGINVGGEGDLPWLVGLPILLFVGLLLLLRSPVVVVITVERR